MIVLVRGVTYPSVRACAEALGVTIFAVYSALERGALDTLGLGKTKAQPVEVEGLHFRSLSAASVTLGLNRSYLRFALASGSPVSMDRVRFAAQRYKARLEMDAARAASGKGEAYVA
ncbi:hypothetical protein UFOVP233_44 [uncultured Caudovirales phage]|uniref:Uncharacterized protein n=1 Tax=uncultured Caudovirales phage TaxID=2100421 RepID=A0A6J7WRA5_9CAUD|nr:hypothetical protein UFOVP233_44 [uncultured Caudovirales phage]